MAAAAEVISGAIPAARRNTFFTGTPEIYFAKAIDNSRLVKVEDPRRNREMKQFATALACLFLLVFTYAWQHFRAIEYGYLIESSKRELNNLTEMNRALHLEDASLRDPERIDVMARRMGLVPPEPGQVMRMDSAAAESNTAVVASGEAVVIMPGQERQQKGELFSGSPGRPAGEAALPRDIFGGRPAVGPPVCLAGVF